MLSNLNISDVAKLLGVSASTVKRMCDRGTIPFAKTAGGHRRFETESLDAVLQEVRGLCLDAMREPACDLTVDDIVARLISGDHKGVSTWLSASRTTAETVRLFDDLFAPALLHVAQQCQRGLINHYQSQIAVDVARKSLSVLAEQVPEALASPLFAIGGTIADEHDDLAARMLEISLRLVPLPILYLGSHLSPSALAYAANDLRPKMVWICHALLADPRSLIAWHEQLHQLLPANTRVVLSGSAITPALRHNLPPHYYFATLTELLECISAKEFAVQ